MKVIILAGGLGTRIAEETSTKPKPMVDIAGRPMLWHIMHNYSTQGFSDFIIATGYKGELIRDWVKTLKEGWNVSTLDTGFDTQTGGRLLQVINSCTDSIFMATYGDGLSNVSIKNLLSFHKKSETLATVTAVRPPARFGYLQIENNLATHFGEKNQSDEGWINGGFFVFERKVTNFIKGPQEPLETGALPRLASAKNLAAFQHFGFWQPMDTLREKNELEKLALNSPAPWVYQEESTK
jgi:glucose-1-phosphate cytidylyltransferase